MSKYKYSDSTQIAEHFNVSEFRCECGDTHDTLIDPALPEKLEKLRSRLGCRSIVITSGYRCEKHDKAVGGNGFGQHTKGTAADIICYGADGKPVSSKKVCCAAQDIGFTGIANIDSSYTATHVDVRSSGTWYGDETVTTAYSVTDDFYKYWGISRDVPAAKTSHSITITLDGKTYSGTVS